MGCALSTNSAMFLIFRFIAGCAGAAPMAIVGGSIADMYVPDERGTAMAIFSIGPMFGPVSFPPLFFLSTNHMTKICQVIGPVAGGFLSEYSGWRWTFWLVFIMVSIVLSSILLMVCD